MLPTAVALLTLVGWGWPHTELKESDPVADAVLDASPSAVTLIYTTEVQLALSTVTIRHAEVDGWEAAAGDLTYLAEDRHDALVLPLSESLSSGRYVVAWTTAGPDGHALSGEFGFGVELPAAEPDAEEPAADAAEVDVAAAPGDEAESGGEQEEAGDPGAGLDLVPMATRFLFYGGIVGLLGAVAFRLLVLGQGARTGVSQAVNDAAARRVRNIAVFGLVALMASLPIRLWQQAEAFFPGDVAGNLFTVATGTTWGAGWWLQLGLVVLLAGGIGLARADAARSVGWAVTTVGVLILPVVPVLSGHGWADSPRVLSAAATYLHVVAAGGWVGGLMCLLFAGLPALRQRGGGADTPGLAGMVGAFSRVAQIAVALLLVTGAIKVWIHIGAVSDLWTTAWGRSLLVKDVVVAGVLALGLYNWRVVRPALAATPRAGILMKPAVIELILGAAAVAVTSYLVAQPLT